MSLWNLQWLVSVGSGNRLEYIPWTILSLRVMRAWEKSFINTQKTHAQHHVQMEIRTPTPSNSIRLKRSFYNRYKLHYNAVNLYDVLNQNRDQNQTVRTVLCVTHLIQRAAHRTCSFILINLPFIAFAFVNQPVRIIKPIFSASLCLFITFHGLAQHQSKSAQFFSNLSPTHFSSFNSQIYLHTIIFHTIIRLSSVAFLIETMIIV